MDKRIFKIDEEMSKIIDAKVGNPQNSTRKKWANLSQPWNLAFFHDYIFNKKYTFPWLKSTRVKKRPYLTVKRAKTPKNESHKSLQSWPDVLQHPVVV